MKTRWSGAYGLEPNPYIKLPSVPSHTGSPSVPAAIVFNPDNNPSVITKPFPFIERSCAINPNVLLDVASDAFEALLTIILVPSALVTYTA